MIGMSLKEKDDFQDSIAGTHLPKDCKLGKKSKIC